MSTSASKIFRIALLLSGLIALPLMAGPPSSAADLRIRAQVDELLAKMTLDEKVGQLTQIGGINLMPDELKPEERVQKGQGGSILWLADPVSINRLQRIAVEQTRVHIPLLFGLDVIHGFKTMFPIPLAMAASWDTAMVEQAQAVAAREARAAGIQWTFAPMLDIARDARWGRMIEGAGEDPYLGSAMAEAQVKGFQGSDVSNADRMLACAKHFAGYGAADGGRDYEAAYIPDDLLWNVYFPPFHAALKAGVATFMSAYMDLNDVPATANRFLLRDVLRQAWGFNGFVVSDASAVKDLVTHGFARDPQDAAFSAFTAGVNMDMASRTYLDHLGSLVKGGRITESAVDDMVRPILAAKFRLGLFERNSSGGRVSVLSRRRNSARMSAATLETEVLPPVFDAIGCLTIATVICSVYGLAEHLIVPLKTCDILRRLNQESKQIQKCRGVLGLWIERVEIGALDLDGVAVAHAPFAVEIQTLPAVADGGPDLAPSGLRPQHVNHHPSAVAAWLVAV